MFNKIVFLGIICYLLRPIVCIDNSVWDYHLWLDPHEKYSLKWSVNNEDQTITFLCEVQTKGWIGFGLSPNGGMKGSDLIIGWVDDQTGLAHFTDRYASGEFVPKIDESQDWHLLESHQNSTHTIIRFYRPLISCDKEWDRDITRETIRLIYAFGDSDPNSETEIKIHGRHERGAKSVLLLTLPDSHTNRAEETDLQSIVLNVKNITIPKKETTYWCKIFKIPEEKVHVVKFGVYVIPENEPFTHHITVSMCSHPNSHYLDQYLQDEGADCTDFANMNRDFRHCFRPAFMWAAGGGDFLMPKDVGYPVAGVKEDSYFLLNIHYDNPELIEGVVDSSGLELHFTRKLRKYESFTLITGSAMDNRIFVPPKQPNFHISGHCRTDCFQHEIGKDGLNVFAVWPHGHTLARKIKVRHFRGDEELPWIEFDTNFDYNLQTFRYLEPMVKFLSGDQITVECEFDSTLKRKTVMGGLGTYDEMCAAFFYYYPRLTKGSGCFTGMSDKTARTLADIQHRTDLTHDSGLVEYLSEKQDWNQSVLNNSHQVMLNAKQRLECYWIKTEGDLEFEDIGYPNVKKLYSPEERVCLKSGEDIHTIRSHFMNVVVIAVVAITVAIVIVFALIYLKRRSAQNHNRLI